MDIQNLLNTTYYYPEKNHGQTLHTKKTNHLIKKPKHQHRTSWTDQEDYLLKRGYRQGLSWAMISATYLPHRSRGCCWGRFKILQAKSSPPDDLLSSRKQTQLFRRAWRSVALDRECDFRLTRITTLLKNL